MERCARENGHAAADRDAYKTRKYASNNMGSDNFIPLSHETYGRLGKPAMQLLNTLADVVEAEGRSTKAAFLDGAYAELSVALQFGNQKVFTQYQANFARIDGRHVMHGQEQPSALFA